jgi:hypothetical protein
MIDRRTVNIVCAQAPRRCVPAIRYADGWRCSWCGARVKVVA